MDSNEAKNLNYFQDKATKIVNKVEKTPMEKFFVFFLILITFSSVVLGYMQIKKNIEGPALASYLNRRRGELIEKYTASSVTTEEELATRLKNQDSDLDGLDDWSELNVYGTSPYLTDTDNDGLSDRVEITRGSNPNCPEGLDCSAISPIFPVVGTEDNTELTNIINNLGEADLETLLNYEQDLLSGKVKLDQLGINNPELQQVFDQMAVTSAAGGSGGTEDATQAIIDLQSLTPAQLRVELVSRGLDQATLDQLDDQSLLEMRDQIISSYQ